jgi:two-component system, response regulator PdtaR
VQRTSRILIVEDEFLIAMELDQTLRSAVYQVLGPAHNVSAALELLRAERPDAAVLDVNLAGEWVTPVAEVLRAMFVPFILASGYRAADLSADPLLRDAVNVGKPSGSKLLLKELGAVLRNDDTEPLAAETRRSEP